MGERLSEYGLWGPEEAEAPSGFQVSSKQPPT